VAALAVAQGMGNWAVYEWCWITVYTSSAQAEAGVQEVQWTFDRDWAGRVKPDHSRVAGPVLAGRAALQIFKPNLLGVWRDEPLPRKDKIVVEVGSDAERELQDYGKRMLSGG
jgi:hypothetical protein